MLRKNCRQRNGWLVSLLLLVAAFGVFFVAPRGSNTSYEADELVEKFSAFSAARVVPFQIEALVLDDSGHWQSRRGYCTAPLVYATERWLYGLVAQHCIESKPTRKMVGLYVLSQPVTILEYHQPPNEIRIFRVPNTTMWRGQIVGIATRAWHPGVRTFVVGVQRTERGTTREQDVFTKWYTTGLVQSEQDGQDLWEVGDFVHSAAATFGFSGGPAYVYDTQDQQFKLLAVNVAIELVSVFTYSYAVPEDLITIIQQDAAYSKDEAILERARFANWDEIAPEVRQRWESLYRQNAPYRLEPFVAILVGGERFGIGPKEQVQDAWLHDRLPALGSLQRVDWREFLYVAP